jgi:hypothetical protein
MKIYTKTGDAGTSSLYNGTRLPKNSPIFKLLGDIDELNCNLGMVKAIHKEIILNSDIKLYCKKISSDNISFSTVNWVELTGFKIRNSNNAWNGSGTTYYYMAFAENPFVSSKGIPTTAR